MADDIASFLATSPIFSEVPLDQLVEIVPLFRREKHAAGTVILRQGGWSDAVYFLRSGQVAVRIQRGGWRETVAYLQPPDIFGELSFVTNRPCVADVEVLVDAEVLLLHRDVIPQLPEHRDMIFRSLMGVIAERLHETLARSVNVRETPVVLLMNQPGWEAPRSFGWELARSLGRQTERKTLLVNLGGERERSVHDVEPWFAAAELPTLADEDIRSELAQRLTEWKRNFENVILNPVGRAAVPVVESSGKFANWIGFLLGPGDKAPAELAARRFVVQGTENPRLPSLSGNSQLALEAPQSEAAHLAGRPVSARFRRTVDSIARCIAGLQVGLALGGGAAWGWAHIGVLDELEKAGLPVDVIAGCSMGSVVGALYSSGFNAHELKEVACFYGRKPRRFIEWRFWKMCLINEKKICRTLRQYFGNREVNRTDMPYWANAVDIRTGKECTIQTGLLVDCVRASIALPGLLPPFARGAHLLVDAGIMDPVPVIPLRRMGCHFAIGVNSMAKLDSQQVSNRYPFNAIDVLTRSMSLMGHEIGQARSEQAANVVFTPELGDITMLQFSRSVEIIECGRRAAQAHLPAILAGYERLKSNPADQREPAPAEKSRQVEFV